MTLTLDFAQMIGLCITIIGAVWGVGKAFFSRFENSTKERDKVLENLVQRLEKGQEQHGKEIHRLEKDMLLMQADLPKTYVHKDDFNRAFTVVDAKLDKIWQTLPKRDDS